MSTPITDHKQIVRGDDYKAADGRSLSWYSEDWPNLAGAQLELVIGHDEALAYGVLPAVWKGTLPSTPTPTNVAHLDATHAQTKELPEGFYDYLLRATLVDSSLVTLAVGKLTVQAEPGLSPLTPQ